MTRDRSGIALVLCAPSGTGKTTLTKRLLAEFPRFAFSISYTTRAPRTGEVHGRDYYFVSVDEFVRLRDQGFFAEWAHVHGNYYGTPLRDTQQLLEEGRDVLFDIDVQGARQVRQTMQNAVFIFVMPPSKAELERRLSARGTDDAASIAKRLANAAQELRDAPLFDYWIINDDLETAYESLRVAYCAATLAPHCQNDFVTTLLQGWGG